MFCADNDGVVGRLLVWKKTDKRGNIENSSCGGDEGQWSVPKFLSSGKQTQAIMAGFCLCSLK